MKALSTTWLFISVPLVISLIFDILCIILLVDLSFTFHSVIAFDNGPVHFILTSFEHKIYLNTWLVDGTYDFVIFKAASTIFSLLPFLATLLTKYLSGCLFTVMLTSIPCDTKLLFIL